MAAERDDDALSWGGDTDPTHVDAPAPAEADTADDAPELAGTSSTMLVVYGIFGGIYLLFTVGWLITALHPPAATSNVLDDFMTRTSIFLAVLAAPAWFVAALVLTATRPPWQRIVALLIGIVVLLPWAFVTGHLS